MRWRSRGDQANAPGGATARSARARWSSIGVASLGAVLGGLTGGFVVVGVTLVLKAGIELASGRNTWFAVTAPLLGLLIAVLVLHGYGTTATGTLEQTTAGAWRSFHPEAARADISAD